MENLQIILSLCGTALGLLVTTVTFLAKFITNAKAKKAAEQIVKIGNAIIPYIEQAEKFIGYTGAEKKEYVLTRANQFAITQGIDFNALAVSDKIEELVKLSKEVNQRSKEQVNDRQSSQNDNVLSVSNKIKEIVMLNNEAKTCTKEAKNNL